MKNVKIFIGNAFFCILFACGTKAKITSISQEKSTEIKTTNNKNFGTDTTDAVNILDFGAIPDDNLDDSKAIQKAIDFALANTKKGKVYIPAGVFDMYNGVVIGHKLNDGQYFFVTLTITGHIAAYTGIRSIGNTSVFRMHHKGFGIAVQLARQCVIENLVFEGVALYDANIEHMVNWTKEDWGIKAGVIDNLNSPSCAIVIDPFHINVAKTNRYKNFENEYTNSGSGGSSMITIRGCAFNKQYICIANNPSAGNANGDNIRAENCNIETCHTFWSAGQTQSRANSIQNVYAIFVHTFINCKQIGSQNGTPPTVDNANIAGFCKQVLNVLTDFSGISFNRCNMESIWSLGVAMSNATSFNQCQIQFQVPDNKIFAPPFHIYNNNVTSFRDCSIEYFNNCNTKMPFMMHSRAVLISGGLIQGGVVVADGYTNSGGDNLNKVTFDNVMINCLGQMAGRKSTSVPASNFDFILMGGETMIADGNIYVNSNTTYNVYSIENATVTIDAATKKGKIITKNPQLYKLGLNLFPEDFADASVLGVGQKIKTYLGYVSAINGNTIEITGIPQGQAGGTYYLYAAEYPTFNPTAKTKGVLQYKPVQ